LDRGRVVVFQPAAGGLPSGAYHTATDVTASLRNDTTFDPNDPGRTAQVYFKRLFQSVELDLAQVQHHRRAFDFPAADDAFQMIESGSESVAITGYGTSAERDQVAHWLHELAHGHGNARRLHRKLQPYLVSLYPHEAQRYRAQGFLSVAMPDGAIPEWGGEYDRVRGLVATDREPENFIA
jgi:CRISPR-associated endonuclease/helicase Cas3